MEPLQREPGAAEDGGPAAQQAAEVDVLALFRLREQMKQQLMECSSAVHTSQESYPDPPTEGNIVTNATADLERDLDKVKGSFQNKTLALQRMQLIFALRNKMKQNDNDSRQIMETMKHIVELSHAVFEFQQQAREKEQKLADIRRKRLSLKKAGGQKLLQIHTMMKKQKEEQASMALSSTLDRIYKNFQKEREMTTVIQNVFQNIIIGSRVNWAEDPSLKAVVLELEKNVHFL